MHTPRGPDPPGGSAGGPGFPLAQPRLGGGGPLASRDALANLPPPCPPPFPSVVCAVRGHRVPSCHFYNRDGGAGQGSETSPGPQEPPRDGARPADIGPQQAQSGRWVPDNVPLGPGCHPSAHRVTTAPAFGPQEQRQLGPRVPRAGQTRGFPGLSLSPAVTPDRWAAPPPSPRPTVGRGHPAPTWEVTGLMAPLGGPAPRSGRFRARTPVRCTQRS